MPLTLRLELLLNRGWSPHDNVAVAESGSRRTQCFSGCRRTCRPRPSPPSRVSQGTHDGAQKHRSQDHGGDAEYWEKYWPDLLQRPVTATSPERCAHPAKDGEDVRDEGHGAPARSKMIDR